MSVGHVCKLAVPFVDFPLTPYQTATTQNLLETTHSDLADADSHASSLESQLSTLQSSYNKTSSDLATMQAIYPLRHFTSATELRQWLAANDISELPDTSFAETLIDRILQLQEAASRDGYFISLNIGEDPDFFYISATALVNGLIWSFDVETDEALQWFTLRAVR